MEEKKNIFGLPHKARPYQCLNCGHEQEVKTNHTGVCLDVCKSCSWKGAGFGDDGGFAIPALGTSNYRRFEYTGEA